VGQPTVGSNPTSSARRPQGHTSTKNEAALETTTNRDNDEEAMRQAIAEARRALEHGDVPVGAVALVGGTVVAARHNERETRPDATAHAEMLLLQDLAGRAEDWRLGEVTIVVTLEPCPMCAGAMVQARIGGLVFGAYDPKGGAVGSLYNLLADPRLNHEVPVTAGVLAEECAELLTSFFSGRRGIAGPSGGEPNGLPGG
jgi:tRNA(adenine34) deaminase